MSITNAQYDQIKREYEARRREAILENDKRVEYVKEHVDGYRELSDAISGLSLEHTKRALAGDKAALAELKLLIDDLSNQKSALIQSAGLPADYLEPHFVCPDCKDTGYIGQEKCHCFEQRIITLMYNQSGIKDNLEAVNFDMVSDQYYRGDDLSHFTFSKKKAVNFVDNFDSVYQNLLFYGTVGVGKSLLSSCIAKELLDTGHSVIYFSAASLFDALSKETFNYHSDKSGLEQIYNCDLLIIDDLGTEMSNSFTISALFSLLSERALRHKSIVISTNLSLEKLRDIYSDRIFSRLTGSFSFCRMTGPDIRLAHKLSQ